MTPAQLKTLNLEPATRYKDCTHLYTSLVRDDLFTWLEELCSELPVDERSRLHISTWEIDDHPTPEGTTFTLYAITVVVMSRSV